MMFALLSPKLWLALALAGVLAISHGFAYKSGRAAVRVQWDKERAETTAAALVASEAARAKEQVLTVANAKVANDYQTEKRRRVADAVVADSRLRELQATLNSASSTDTSAATGTDADPRLSIIAECAGAALKLDSAVKDLAGQASALQSFAKSVCISQ